MPFFHFATLLPFVLFSIPFLGVEVGVDADVATTDSTCQMVEATNDQKYPSLMRDYPANQPGSVKYPTGTKTTAGLIFPDHPGGDVCDDEPLIHTNIQVSGRLQASTRP